MRIMSSCPSCQVLRISRQRNISLGNLTLYLVSRHGLQTRPRRTWRLPGRSCSREQVQHPTKSAPDPVLVAFIVQMSSTQT